MDDRNSDEPRLPADLAGLERQLAARGRLESIADPRRKILAAVRRELRVTIGDPLDWRWLAAAAASLLIALNFSASVINDMDWHFNGGMPHGSFHATVRRVQDLVPEMSPQEAYRQALLLQASARVAPPPVFPSALNRILNQRERELWDIH
jgi:hypothetical protein